LIGACRSIIGLSDFVVDPNPEDGGADSGQPSGDGDGDDGNGSGSGNGDGDGDGDGDNGGDGDGDGDGGGDGDGDGDNGGGGNSAGGMSAGGNGSGGQPAGGGAGSGDCGEQPSFEPCTTGPGQCDGQCQTANGPMGPYDVCIRQCESDDCGGAFVTNEIAACGPPEVEFPCLFLCEGGCSIALEVSCPSDAPCTIDCTMPGACLNSTITCRNGGCLVMCSDAGCDVTTEVNCGTGPCLVDCVFGGDVTQNAGPSCDAQTMGCGG
jgi:hypothetical protein